MKKPSMAIVSTFDDLCGIAGYTRFLIDQLSEDFNIQVFDLDQYFMRSNHPSVAKHAEKIISDMVRDLKKFDHVNIQLEYGTLGRDSSTIISRFKALAGSAKNLSVTFHTVLPQTPFPFGPFFEELLSFKIGKAILRVASHRRSRRLTNAVYGSLRRLQKQNRVSIIVHTRRDARLMRYVNQFDNVFDHPLAFVSPTQAETLKSTTSIDDFPQLKKLDGGSKIIGVFGFLGEYKGFDTAVKALFHLPENYHLAFFGGLHPNEVLKGQSVHPYIKKLLDTGHINSHFDLLQMPQTKVANFSVADKSFFELRSNNLASRLHFMGPQTDAGFAQAMAVCDCVVLPYLEVGQSSSGPISIAVDMGAPIVAARNQAFAQFSRYHAKFGETFEIGNFLELAEKIQVVTERGHPTELPVYNTVTNRGTYVAAHLGAAK
ncbi:hypothetical protein [Agrobacterium larrymoorei]|uniref:Glycosyltransferase involved in cell wall biosynthesis n=1 Tax=Agrobacterium larrymoorei TaxID=160699 RepID=A0ABU0UIE6_9HYPH|nr:hypothetical protein [Agrobacterium larrymoorei]MDQ1184628.1 glycosyltransferase involved in cell wall biosynthesis [Agrobacterium larrymoorei]